MGSVKTKHFHNNTKLSFNYFTDSHEYSSRVFLEAIRHMITSSLMIIECVFVISCGLKISLL